MKGNWPERKGASIYWGEFFELSEGVTFHVGDTTEDEPIKKRIVCKACGGDKFIVGQGGYATAIKCPTCKREAVIHEG